MSGVAQRAQMVDVLSAFKSSKKQAQQAQQIVKRPSERKMDVHGQGHSTFVILS